MRERTPPTDPDGLDDLSLVLDLEPRGEGTFRSHLHQGNHARGIFGGTILAQALVAAERTVSGRAPHSMHALFLRAGATGEPVDYSVDSLREGASFAARRVRAVQADKLLFEALVSFQTTEPGFSHTRGWSQPPLEPEAVPTLLEFADLAGTLVSDKQRMLIAFFDRVFETRIVDPEDFLLRKSAPRGRFWVRPRRTAQVPLPSAYAALAFVSDWLMPAMSNLPHMESTFDERLLALSLDHAIWFHHPVGEHDWMFYEAESPWAGSGRGLNFGHLYSRAGLLLASTAQEDLMRARR